MPNLLDRVSHLPDGSIIYYLHIFQDGAGRIVIPAEGLEGLAARSNAPIYGHVDTYIGRERSAAACSHSRGGGGFRQLGLRILAGERPETISIPRQADGTPVFDARQLRANISRDRLPPAASSNLRSRTSGTSTSGTSSALRPFASSRWLIIGLLVQRANLWRVKDGLKKSQRELRLLTGRLLRAQEMERRRIARELHDDLSQNLGLLSVEIDLLGQQSPRSADGLGGRMQDLSDRVKLLASSVHNLSHQLHPSKLEQLGLAAAIHSLCKEMSSGHGVQIEFTLGQSPTALSEDVALCLYPSRKETLRNIIEHSGAAARRWS